MYAYSHDPETGGLLLSDSPSSFSKEPRPVYSRELDLLGFNQFWTYEQQDERPYLWAEANFYWYRGKRVAKTIGGNLFERPKISLEEGEDNTLLLPLGSRLKPVDIESMVQKNIALLDALEKSTEAKIFDIFQKYRKKLDCFHVAFSGGKDSIVLLELVNRSLPAKDFFVIFGDTGMEFSDTYEFINLIEKNCKNLGIEFYRAKSHLSPEQSWKLFGPPSQVLRWCCSVHKSTPQTLKLREILGKKSYTGMDFVGVRRHESERRATYQPLNYGKKQKGQYAFYPILEWSSAEIWLYIYYRKLNINMAYKKGNSRVGCLLCPMGAGGKSDWFRFVNYKEDVNRFLSLIKETINQQGKYLESYIKNNAWVNRKSGRDLHNNNSSNIYSEKLYSDKYILSVKKPISSWKEWAKTLPDMHPKYTIIDNKDEYSVTIQTNIYGTPFSKILRSVCHKATFCIECRTCESNCPYGAISFKNGFHIENCVKCGVCHTIDSGCLVYHSIQSKTGEHNMKSLNTFNDHAPKIYWISDFFSRGNDFLNKNSLGPNQNSLFRRFLSDAKLIEKHEVTPFFTIIKNMPYDSPNAWGLILIILAHTNPQILWYIKNMPLEQGISAETFEEKLTALSISKKDAASIRKAFGRLCDIQLGTKLHFGSYSVKGKMIVSVQRNKPFPPDPLVFLYGLYKFSEACDGYYEFTLSRLLDFTIESSGVSPAEIFALSRVETEQYLHGLARSNPEFISFSTTHGLELIRLADEKKSEDVLSLF